MTASEPVGERPRPVRRADKISENVAREIVRKITREALAPGTQLSTEAQMLANYQVGRGTLREALRILEVNGLISLKPGPGGGPVVRYAAAEDFGRMATLFFNSRGLTLRELIEARLIMEPVTARLAAERRPETALKRLAEIAEFNSTDDEAYALATHDFHSLVVHLSGNGVIAIFAEALATLFHDRVKGILFPPGKARRDVIAVHSEIARAIIDKNASLAERLMYEHMEMYLKFVKKNHPTLIDEVIDWRR